jgi:hypothetical protein
MLIQPAGRQLAALKPETLTQLHLYPSPEGIAVHIQPLRDAEPVEHCVALAPPLSIQQVADSIARFTTRVEAEIARFRPTGPVSAGSVSDLQRAYYLLQERCRDLRENAARLVEATTAPSGPQFDLPAGVFQPARKGTASRPWTPSSFWASVAREESDMHTFHQSLRDLFDRSDILRDIDAAMLDILHEAALTEVELISLKNQLPTRIGLCVRPLDGRSLLVARVLSLRIQECLSQPANESDIDLGIDCAICDLAAEQQILLELNGLSAVAIAQSESGIHLDYYPDSQVRVIQVIPIPLHDGQTPVEAWQTMHETRTEWLSALAHGAATITGDPLKPGPIVRLYETGGLTLDMRTGNMTEDLPDARAWRRFLLGAFALPPEFR